jgi:hypothetical protein
MANAMFQRTLQVYVRHIINVVGIVNIIRFIHNRSVSRTSGHLSLIHNMEVCSTLTQKSQQILKQSLLLRRTTCALLTHSPNVSETYGQNDFFPFVRTSITSAIFQRTLQIYERHIQNVVGIGNIERFIHSPSLSMT